MSKNMKYQEVRRIVYKRYKGKCAICRKPIALEEMTIDHILPKSKGGGGDFSNMQAVCESCNMMKHYLTNEEFFRKVFMVAAHNIKNIFKAYVNGGNFNDRRKKANY